MTRDEVIVVMYNEYMRIRNMTSQLKESKDAYNNISKDGGAADRCIQLGADPVLYVQALNKFKSTNVFFPNLLLSKDAAHQYQKLADETKQADSNSFDVQLQYLVGAIRGGRSIESTLLDDRLQMDAWFRVVISKDPIKAVIQRYADEARGQLTEKIRNLIINKNLDINRIYEPTRYI